MYERFSDRARRVMQLANQEAQRFNHEQIGTQHLLLGLLKEGSCVASTVLKNLSMDLRKARLEVEKLVKYGPDMITMGKLPLTQRARNVMGFAIEEACNLLHNHVGTEHLLLGLLRDQECVAVQVLRNLGLTPEAVHREVLLLFPPKAAPTEEELRIKDAQITLTGVKVNKIIVAFKTLPLDDRFKVLAGLFKDCLPELDQMQPLVWTTNIALEQADVTVTNPECFKDVDK